MMTRTLSGYVWRGNAHVPEEDGHGAGSSSRVSDFRWPQNEGTVNLQTFRRIWRKVLRLGWDRCCRASQTGVFYACEVSRVDVTGRGPEWEHLCQVPWQGADSRKHSEILLKAELWELVVLVLLVFKSMLFLFLFCVFFFLPLLAPAPKKKISKSPCILTRDVLSGHDNWLSRSIWKQWSKFLLIGRYWLPRTGCCQFNCACFSL